ncbi:regulator of G-protein signaling loco [Ditylenchus destructor]|uniref:Regulator of G-protein signaling loco n=1 Tax=Ditylenchus destructor TaxID=166010 RepID=A0AAD4R025_9BILA|nr:regulator of G-protein signaling loco [Ditylenchus destructor]
MITALLECGPQGFGFTVEGSRPCKLNVLENSVASLNGVRTGDILVAIDNVNLERADHTKIVEYLRRNVRKRQMLITFRHVDHHNTSTSTINSRSSIFKKHTGNKSRRSIDVFARASTVSSSNDKDKSFGTFLRRMNPLTPQTCRRRCSIHRVDLTSTSDRLTSGTPFKVLSNSINLDVDEQLSLVSVFVTRFIAKTTYSDNQDSSFTVDKTVAGIGSQLFYDCPLAVLRIYEMKVIVQLDNSPSLFCFPYQSIVDAAVSRTNDSVFGIISRATDANKSYFCFAFYVDTQLCEHSVHSAFSESNGLRCRAGINSAREDCDIFPFDCQSIVTYLHYIIPSATDDASTICSALNDTQNSTVSKFLRKFGKHNSGKANDSLFALTNETKAVNLDDDCSTIIDFANSSTSDDEIQKEIESVSFFSIDAFVGPAKFPIACLLPANTFSCDQPGTKASSLEDYTKEKWTVALPR